MFSRHKNLLLLSFLILLLGGELLYVRFVSADANLGDASNKINLQNDISGGSHYIYSVNGLSIGTATTAAGKLIVGANGIQFPDGTQTSAFLGSGTQTITAPNVTSGVFGYPSASNAYAFPAALGVGTNSTAGLPSNGLYIGGNNLTFGSGPSITTESLARLILTATSYTYVPSGVFYVNGVSHLRGGIDTDNAAYLTVNGGTSGYTYFSGNVGVGTTAPLTKLVVSNAGAAGIEINPTGGATGAYIQSYNRSTLAYGGLDFYGSVYSFNTGNVGIGTASPGYKLEVHTATDGNFAVRPGSVWGAGYSGVGLQSVNDAHTVGTMLVLAGAPTVFPDGNVGIGTVSPAKKLEVAGDVMVASTGIIGFRYSAGDNNFYNYITGNGTGPLTLAGGLWTSSDAQEAIRFETKTAGSAKMSILNNGNVGIGTASPPNTLSVYSSAENGLSIDSTYYPDLAFRVGGTAQAYISVEGQGGGGWASGTAANSLILRSNASAIHLINNTTIALTASGGKVGIGKTNPATALDVNGTVTATGFSGPLTGAINASNISSGTFGSNQGNGNFTFPADLTMGAGNFTQVIAHGNNAHMILPAGSNGGGTGDASLYWWISEPGMSWTGAGIARNMYNSTNYPRINASLTGQMMRFDESTGILFYTETTSGTRYVPLQLDGNNAYIGGDLYMGGSKNIFLNGGTTYKISGASAFLDTINTASTGDPLEINYQTAGPVMICASANCATYSAYFNTDGKVGIGKTNPATALDVNGTVTATTFSGSLAASNVTAGTFGAGDFTVNGTLAVSSAANPGFTVGNGSTGYIKLGDGTISKSSGSGFQMNSALVLASYLQVSGNIRLNGYYLSNDGGNEGVYVDASGNVGIGTASPGSYALNVNGTVNSGDLTSSRINVGNTVTYIQQYTDQYPGLKFYTYNGLALTLDPGGNAAVGGTLTVGSYLQVGANIRLSGHWLSNDGGNEGVYVDASGNVGIGTASPEGLQVEAAVTQTARGTDNVRLGVSAGTPRIIFEDNTYTQWQIDNSGGTLRFFQPSSVKMTLDGSGNLNPYGNLTVSGTGNSSFGGKVGIGTASPASLLSVGGDGNSDYAVSVTTSGTGGLQVINNNAAGTGIYGKGHRGVSGEALGTNDYGIFGFSNSSASGIAAVYGVAASANQYGVECIVFSGALCGGNAGWSNSSDIRLKTGVQYISNDTALAKVEQLHGITFKWKDNPTGPAQLGFSAQEVLPVVPEIIGKDGNGYYSMQYAQLTPLLAGAIQEQQKQIEALKAEVESLKNK